MRLAGIVLLGFGVAACQTPGPRVFSVKTELPPKDTFVTFAPGGPAIIGVLEKSFKDAIVRETILETNSKVSGQNFLTVTLRGPVGYRTVTDNALGADSIQPSQINKEFGWYLLGVPMKRSLIYAQNKYGPFGFATGTASTGDRCLYAWQHVGRHQDKIIPHGGGSVTVRLRLCDSRASDQQLLSVMYGFTITGYLSSPLWTPYGKPREVSKDLGGLSAPVEPELPTRMVEPVRKAPPRAKSPPPEVVRPIEGPVVPLPEPGSYDNFATVPVPEG